MELFIRIAEERIRTAQEEGLFDNLPGKGKPLQLDDEDGVPDDLRLTFKVLKNAKCLPPEMEMRKEFFSVGQLLNTAVDEPTRRELRRQLNALALKLSIQQEQARSPVGRRRGR
jgi:hypothetical protein